MPKIVSIEDVYKIYNETAGIQPPITLESIIQAWKALSEMDKKDKGQVKFTGKDLDQLTGLNDPQVTRGIVCFFNNLGLCEDEGRRNVAIETQITYKGSFWFDAVNNDEHKIRIFLHDELKSWKSVRTILNFIHEKMPEGARKDEIESVLGGEMKQFWNLYPKWPADSKSEEHEPAQKPFNSRIFNHFMKILVDLMLILEKNGKYLGPI